MTRIFALIMAYFFLSLAIIGVFLPGIPTVPFLLLTSWFAARGSKRLHTWLYSHHILGKLLTDWEQRRAISRKSKVIAVLMLIASWIILYIRVSNPWYILSVSLLFIFMICFLLTRPE